MIETVEVVEGHTPFFIVHEKFVVEKGDPAPTVTADVARFTLVIVLVPANVDHVPVPAAGVFPASVVAVPQTDIVLPAFDGDEVVYEMIETVELELGQTPFPIDQEKFVIDEGEPGATVTADVARLTLVMVLVPANVLHVPVPTAGTLKA